MVVSSTQCSERWPLTDVLVNAMKPPHSSAAALLSVGAAVLVLAMPEPAIACKCKSIGALDVKTMGDWSDRVVFWGEVVRREADETGTTTLRPIKTYRGATSAEFTVQARDESKLPTDCNPSMVVGERYLVFAVPPTAWRARKFRPDPCRRTKLWSTEPVITDTPVVRDLEPLRAELRAAAEPAIGAAAATCEATTYRGRLRVHPTGEWDLLHLETAPAPSTACVVKNVSEKLTFAPFAGSPVEVEAVGHREDQNFVLRDWSVHTAASTPGSYLALRKRLTSDPILSGRAHAKWEIHVARQLNDFPRQVENVCRSEGYARAIEELGDKIAHGPQRTQLFEELLNCTLRTNDSASARAAAQELAALAPMRMHHTLEATLGSLQAFAQLPITADGQRPPKLSPEQARAFIRYLRTTNAHWQDSELILELFAYALLDHDPRPRDTELASLALQRAGQLQPAIGPQDGEQYFALDDVLTSSQAVSNHFTPVMQDRIRNAIRKTQRKEKRAEDALAEELAPPEPPLPPELLYANAETRRPVPESAVAPPEDEPDEPIHPAWYALGIMAFIGFAVRAFMARLRRPA